jgi:hypothetical protein
MHHHLSDGVIGCFNTTVAGILFCDSLFELRGPRCRPRGFLPPASESPFSEPPVPNPALTMVAAAERDELKHDSRTGNWSPRPPGSP